MATTISVEIQSRAPPACVLARLYMEAMGIRADRMASPRITSGGPAQQDVDHPGPVTHLPVHDGVPPTMGHQ